MHVEAARIRKLNFATDFEPGEDVSSLGFSTNFIGTPRVHDMSAGKMISRRELLSRVRSAFNAQSAAFRSLLNSSRDDPDKLDAIADFMGTLEELRSSLHSLDGDDGEATGSYETELFQWLLGSDDLAGAVQEQLEAFHLARFSELSTIFKEHSIALTKVLIEVLDGEPSPQTVALLTDPKRFILHNPEGLDFWVKHFGSSYSIDFKRLKVALSNLNMGATERHFIQLKVTLDKNNTGFVSAMKWAAFLDGFGPGLVDALTSLGETLSEKFFAGFISYEEAETLLSSCSPGAYLVRFSSSQPCGLVLARKVRTEQGSTRPIQTRIHSQRGCFEVEGTKFSSLKDILEFYADECSFPAPTVKTVARAKYFKGFANKEETRSMLQDERDGTFLIRFSQAEPAALVVGYKTNGRVKQTRIFSEPDKGGYTLDGTRIYYPSIEQLVRDNSTILKYGHVDISERDEEEQTAGQTPVQQPRQSEIVHDRYGGLQHSEYGFVDSLM